MKKSAILLLLALSIGLLLAQGCGKKSDTTLNSGSISSGSTGNTEPPPPPEVVPVPHRNVKTIDLGIADSFAIMAYTSITSAPTSKISGKVGLKPGIRALIEINPKSEVLGGSLDIYAGDDVGDPADYLSMAREDLIGAYRDASSRPADKDKIEAYGGNPGGKILPPGIYRWSNGVNIASDMTLEGDSNDVFIFQITGDMAVAANVRITLSGGARTKNIFWQVSGKVTLESTTVVPGTIMSQMTFEMKSLAKLNGRALVKNSKLVMDQNIITKPSL